MPIVIAFAKRIRLIGKRSSKSTEAGSSTRTIWILILRRSGEFETLRQDIVLKNKKKFNLSQISLDKLNKMFYNIDTVKERTKTFTKQMKS